MYNPLTIEEIERDIELFENMPVESVKLAIHNNMVFISKLYSEFYEDQNRLSNSKTVDDLKNKINKYLNCCSFGPLTSEINTVHRFTLFQGCPKRDNDGFICGWERVDLIATSDKEEEIKDKMENNVVEEAILVYDAEEKEFSVLSRRNQE